MPALQVLLTQRDQLAALENQIEDVRKVERQANIAKAKAMLAELGLTVDDLEAQKAINNVGYNWSELRRIDGATVTYAPNLWKTTTNPFSAPISITQSGGTALGVPAHTNTLPTGFVNFTTSSHTNCQLWTGTGASGVYREIGSTSGMNGTWIQFGTVAAACNLGAGNRFYCIEQ